MLCQSEVTICIILTILINGFDWRWMYPICSSNMDHIYLVSLQIRIPLNLPPSHVCIYPCTYIVLSLHWKYNNIEWLRWFIIQHLLPVPSRLPPPHIWPKCLVLKCSAPLASAGGFPSSRCPRLHPGLAGGRAPAAVLLLAYGTQPRLSTTGLNPLM